MAIVDWTSDTLPAQEGLFIANWSGLTGGDTGAPLAWSNLATKTVQAFGTIGAAITIEGSNDPRVITDPDNAVWIGLTSATDAISFTTPGLLKIDQTPRYVRPKCAAGTTDATVIICASRS